jgi:hypothetical protein
MGQGHARHSGHTRLTVDPVSYGLPAGRYTIRQMGTGEPRILGEFPKLHEIEIILKPRDMILIEASRMPSPIGKKVAAEQPLNER